MGYSKSVEYNLTDVSCKMNYIENDSCLHMTGDIVTDFEQSNIPAESSFEAGDGKDDLIFIGQDQLQFSFTLLTASLKKDLCQKMNVPDISDSAAMQFSRSTMTTPRQEKKILGDGNCFFRAVSFCLTNSEDFYNVMRSAVCQHSIGKKELFEPFLNGEQSIDNHLKSSKMSQEGTWATEVEIFDTAHLLNIDIYIYILWRALDQIFSQ